MTSISIECKSVKTLTITDAMNEQMTESIAHNKPKAGMRSGSGFFLLTIVSSSFLRYVVLLIKITFYQSVENISKQKKFDRIKIKDIESKHKIS